MPVRKIKILLVEDSPTVRMLYKRTFMMKGFEVLEAETGKEAISKAFNEIPDVMCLDMMLPDCTGFAVLKEVRANPDTKHIPILVLTGLKNINDVQKAINLGANYYSVKGKDSPEKLVSMVYKLLERSHDEVSPEAPNESEDTQPDNQIGDDDIEFITNH